MAEPPRLALVVHFHQPVDNLERVVSRAARRCYLPFLDAIAEHPEVTFTLHYSGCLLRWLDQVAPAVVERLGERVAAGQVELLTGGIEEPILAAIPERDRQAQIERMSDLLERRFGSRPRGLWLTERVWEPELAATLSRAGVAHTVVDDSSLRAVGVEEDQLGQPFVTEHEGRTVRLLAASRRLRYQIPYARPATVIRGLEALPPGHLSVYADDGEKFGEWPGTARQVYRRRWLERFLAGLGAASSSHRLRLVTLSQAAGEGRPVPVQLPSGSYDELMTWALPTAARHRLELASEALARSDPEGVAPFVRGAPWRGFQSKYPEVARLEQEMYRVSRKVERAGSPPEAVRELHLGQCNCAYWHGTFGGAYLPFLRLGLWHHLVRAERLVESGTGPGVEVADFDADGVEEVRLFGPWGYATVDPAAGGQVVELVTWEGESNLVAVMGRHRESYHLAHPAATRRGEGLELAPLVAPSVSSSGLEFDAGEVGALRDALGGELWDQPYSVEIEDGMVRLEARRSGVVIVKRLSSTASGIRAEYSLRGGSPGDGPLRVETRSCPWAPGHRSDPVRVIRRPGVALVDQPGSLARLRLRYPAASFMEWSRVVAEGSTLNGVERLVQGVSVVVEAALSDRGTAELALELVPEPVHPRPG